MNYIDMKYRGKVAYQYLEGGEVVSKTYEEVVHKAKCVSSFLLENGYLRETIGVLGHTSYSWACSYLGVQLSNNIVVPMDPQLFLNDYITIVNRVNIRVIFMSMHYKELSEELYKNCPSLDRVVIFEEDFKDIDTVSANSCQICNPDDPGQYMFTSGTTGNRKIVMLSYANIMANLNLETNLFHEGEVAFSVLPSFHCFEIVVGELEILKNGGQICINDKLDNILKNIQRYKPTVMCCVPLVAENLLRNAKKIRKELGIQKASDTLTSEERREYYSAVLFKAFGGNIRLIICGGAKIHEEAVRDYEELGICLVPGYGLTETAASVTTNRPNHIKYASVGTPARRDIYVKIVDGEVLIKGPNVMLGYYQNEEANREVFTEDRWLRTGDLGYIDEDGFLFLTGRKKNLIILDSGENVAPEELESHLMDIPNVLNAMVYENQQKIAAVIYAIEGIEEIKQQIRRFNETLPMYKRIVEVSFLDTQFPTTTSKKVKRDLVLAQLEKNRQNEDYQEAVTDCEKELVHAIQNTLSINRKVGINEDYFSLGGDSYNALELAVMLKIDAQVIYDYPKLRDLALKISEVRTLSEQNADMREDSVNELIGYESHKEIEHAGNHILLTGATGFLGAHILKELLQRPGVHVTCLARGEDRLESIYKYYFHESVLDKVTVVNGDITDEHLGMSEDQYHTLAEEIDMCIHTAAIVHHVGKYEEFQAVNENGTRNVVNFCKEGNILLQYTSTYSVSGIGVVPLDPIQEVFDENVLYIGQNYKENVYVHSKYEAEKLVLEARKEGVDANIFRIGSLSWRSTDMQFQKNAKDNGLVNKIVGWNEIGCYVDKMANFWLDFTQVDECAKALTLLALKKSVNNIYHLFNHKVLHVNDLERIFEKEYEKVSEEEFYKRTKDKMDNKQIANYVFYNSLALRSEPVPMNSSYTVNCLKELGFEWGKVGKDYVLEGIKKVMQE